MVIDYLPSTFIFFEDGTVWKIKIRRSAYYWYRYKGPDEYVNRPQELEKFEYFESGTLYGTNETVWWGYDPQRRGWKFVYNSKTKETRRFVRQIHDTNTTDVGGVLFDKVLNCRVQCVKHITEHRCYRAKTARCWWLSPSKVIDGFICRKVGSNSSKEFYLVSTKEAEHRFEFKDFRASQQSDKSKKRKEKKQLLTQKRRKKEKLVSKTRRRARDHKYLQC